MKNLKKTIAMISSVVMAGSVFAACGGSTEGGSDTQAPAAEGETTVAAEGETEAAPAEGETEAAPAAEGDAAAADKLTVLCWNTDDIDPMLKLFCEKTGHSADEFNVKSFGCGGGEAAENYDAYLADANNDADILFVEADWALKYINDDNATQALSNIGFSDADYADLYDYTIEIGKSSSGVQKGLSWQAAAGGFCYREDLAEKYLGVTTPDDFQALVSDWDKFMDTAAKVKEASGGETALTSTLAGVWQVFSAARTNPWVSDNKLQLDDECKKYIDLAKTMYDNGYVIKDLAQWNNDWYAAGQTDSTMGYFVSTWGFGDAILSQAAGGEGGATYGKWKVVVGPQPFYWGGTWATVATRCNNPELAKEFISFFTTNAETAQAYSESKGEYVSNQKAMEGVLANGSYTGVGVLGGQNQFETLNVVAENINMAGGITPYDSVIKQAFNDAVTGYCQGNYADVDATIDAFVDTVAAQLPDLDYSNFD
ncbi:MAG: ABC transporter substrate-binding protein [Oscillospiraceae bacterium]|nr:ABC transporter substrate-binding protein [Oscillospiraceae bacterium]